METTVCGAGLSETTWEDYEFGLGCVYEEGDGWSSSWRRPGPTVFLHTCGDNYTSWEPGWETGGPWDRMYNTHNNPDHKGVEWVYISSMGARVKASVLSRGVGHQDVIDPESWFSVYHYHGVAEPGFEFKPEEKDIHPIFPMIAGNRKGSGA